MQEKPAVSLYLDTRRSVAAGGYPVKVRVTWQLYLNGKATYSTKYFSTGQSLTEEEFYKVMNDPVRGRLRDAQEIIFKAKYSADKIVKDNPFISIPQFKLIYSGKTSAHASVVQVMDEIIQEKMVAGKVGTAESYNAAKASIIAFAGSDINLVSIDARWLKKYEESITDKGRSLNTVGFYLRALRAAFNRAIDNKLIPVECYPFGRKGYQIRKKRAKKKSIPVIVKNTITAFKTDHAAQAKALDYALFSYYCNGMNFADMAYLTKENFHSNQFTFIRRKTVSTIKEQVEIKILLTAKIREILKRRGGHSPYIFGIIDDTMDAERRHKVIKQWIKTTNKWINKIAKKIGYKERITTYSMRHTFVSQLINGNIPLTKIKDALGHTSILTTQYYAEDLDLETSKKFDSLL